LVPISPLGEPAHYEALRETLRSCDLVATAATASSQRGLTKLRDLEWNPQWERIGRGPRVRLDAPPDAWDGVGRPFIAAPAVPTNGAAWRRRPPRIPLWLVPLEPLCPLMAMIFSRYASQVLVGHMLAAHTRQSLWPNLSGLSALDAYCRYCAEQLR
jgi:hypothetical protein